MSAPVLNTNDNSETTTPQVTVSKTSTVDNKGNEVQVETTQVNTNGTEVSRITTTTTTVDGSAPPVVVVPVDTPAGPVTIVKTTSEAVDAAAAGEPPKVVTVTPATTNGAQPAPAGDAPTVVVMTTTSDHPVVPPQTQVTPAVEVSDSTSAAPTGTGNGALVPSGNGPVVPVNEEVAAANTAAAANDVAAAPAAAPVPPPSTTAVSAPPPQSENTEGTVFISGKSGSVAPVEGEGALSPIARDPTSPPNNNNNATPSGNKNNNKGTKQSMSRGHVTPTNNKPQRLTNSSRPSGSRGGSGSGGASSPTSSSRALARRSGSNDSGAALPPYPDDVETLRNMTPADRIRKIEWEKKKAQIEKDREMKRKMENIHNSINEDPSQFNTSIQQYNRSLANAPAAQRGKSPRMNMRTLREEEKRQQLLDRISSNNRKTLQPEVPTQFKVPKKEGDGIWAKSGVERYTYQYGAFEGNIPEFVPNREMLKRAPGVGHYGHSTSVQM